MFDTGDYSDNFTFNELVIAIEPNADRFSSSKIGSSERFIYHKHLRCILAIAPVEQSSLLQLHSCRFEERRCYYAVIGDSFVGLLIVRLTGDPEWLFHRAATKRQVRYRANRSHTRQRAQCVQCLMIKLRAPRTAVRIVTKTQRQS